jgi:hypothetical protein
VGLGVAVRGPRRGLVRRLAAPARLGCRVGLRLGASRASDTEALRFDLARRFANDAEEAGWVVTVGKGFTFSPLGRRGL